MNLWLLANKISLNATKTELIFFRKPSQKRPLIKIKVNGVRIAPVKSLKYLGVFLDEFLTGNSHCTLLITKLSRAIGMIAKIRHFLHDNQKQLLSLYHSIFSSHMIYGCQTWGLNDTPLVRKIQTLQNRALRLVTFADQTNSTFNHHNDIYKKLRLLKFRDFVDLRNLVFVHDYFNNALPESFTEYFTLSSNTHSHNTRTSIRGTIHVHRTNSVKFGSNSLSWEVSALGF